MSKLRLLAGLAVLAVTGLLVPATPAAAAAVPLKAFITCDGETGAITTWVSGRLFLPGPATAVTVEFQRLSGTRVTATASSALPPMAAPFMVTTTTATSGDILASGYTGTFNPATSVYYQEKVRVTMKDAAGAFLSSRDATCDYDQRTTVSVACDPGAGTVTATVTGVNGQAGSSGGAGRPATVAYHIARIGQSSASEPGFRSETAGGWDLQHRVVQAAGATWSDLGYVHTITTNPYYYAEELTVGVFDSYGIMVGAGSGRCTLFDGRVTGKV